MQRLLAYLFACLVFALVIVAPAHADTLNFPTLSGRVVDTAHILSADQAAALEAKLQAIQANTGHQVVVATIPDLQGHPIDDYGYQLGRAWGIGSKDKNDGALILVAPNDHKVRIEVGYGLEPIVTDALSTVIIRNQMTPSFRQGDYAGGLNGGVDALAGLLKLPPDQAAAQAKQMVADQAAADAGRGAQGFNIFNYLPIIIFLLFFLSSVFRRRRGGMGGGLPIFLWGGGLGGGGFGGYGGSDNGFGGGGGFSGGGGSFGGGGASGSW